MRRREAEIATIRDLTHEGWGVAETEGKTAFVAAALPGESVRFVRRKGRRNYDEAELLEVIEPSTERVTPRCPYFGRCGGCVMQHLAPDAQRAHKQAALRENLERIGDVRPQRWLPPVAADSPWHYRRRARLAVKDVPGKGRVLVGFRERHAPYVTDMSSCEVLGEPVASLIAPLSELIGRLSIRRRLPQIEVAIADAATSLVFRVLSPPDDGDRALLSDFGAKHGVSVALQPGGADSVVPLSGEGTAPVLSYALPAHDVEIVFEPTDFIQVNGPVNRLMVDQAIRLLEVEPQHRVLDLFCGIGNFTLPLARQARQVTGVEGDSRLLERASDNACRNGIGNAGFVCQDLFALDGSEPWFARGAERMLLDPPRSGAAEVVRHIGRAAPERIVYVSCHPATLARDAGSLVHEAGYTLEAAGVIDMFPHTAHVESIAVFDLRPGSAPDTGTSAILRGGSSRQAG